jgi:hypothetical protein
MKTLFALACFASVAHAETADERMHALTRGNLIVTEDLAPAHVRLKAADQEGYSFDRTAIADAPKLAHARTFTVVGSGGRCEVAAQKRVYIAKSPDARAHVAIELDLAACKDIQPLAVIDGKSDATADALTGAGTSDAWTAAWAERVTGESLDDKIGADRTQAARRVSVPGTKAFVVWANFRGGQEVLVGRGTHLLHRFTNLYVVGVLHDDGDRLIVSADGTLETITI